MSSSGNENNTRHGNEHSKCQGGYSGYAARTYNFIGCFFVQEIHIPLLIVRLG